MISEKYDDVLIKSRPAWQSKGIFTFKMSIVIVFCTALQRLIEKLDEHLMNKHQGKNSRQQKRKQVDSKEFSQCPVPKDALSWAVKTSVRIDIILCSYVVVCCVVNSAQNKGWKLVGHSVKLGTLLYTIIGFPIGNVQ